MKKVLFVASVSSHIMAFHLPYLKCFQEMGWETHVACNSATGYESSGEDIPNSIEIPYCDCFHNVPFQRKPINKKNIVAYKQLKKLMKENYFEIIHCHTPVGGAIGRIAARETRKKGSRVLYTAHGFHFYKGSSFKNWLIYYSIEKLLARYTDCLITINSEDYQTALAKRFKAKKIEKVNGVGIDLSRFNAIESGSLRNERRSALGIADNDIVLLSVGELSVRKNHEIIIRALAQLNDFRVKYLICGSGELHEKLRLLIRELNLEKQVFLMGFQKKVDIFYQISDIFVFPSFQEGLPVSLMEAMAAKLPVICSDIRGCSDLIDNNVGGLRGSPSDVNFWAEAINYLINNTDLLQSIKDYNQKKVEMYGLDSILMTMKRLYFSNKTN